MNSKSEISPHQSAQASEKRSEPEPESALSEANQSQTENNQTSGNFLLILLIGLGLIIAVGIVTFVMRRTVSGNLSSIEDLTIPQPFVENNEFKSFMLPNGIRVIISKSNDGMENSFVALTVGVGSQTDPKDFCGFTHLIEHLLFTGSENYPEDNYIEKVVNKYNGENNGVTKSFTTSYYYKIGKGGMKEFAPVLADAVANPLFDKDRIQKELNNVNSEISMRMTFNKNLGYYKMLKKIGNPEARMYRDGFANIDSSKLDFNVLHNQILNFHKQYYSANIMTLSVITDEELPPTEAIIKNYFSKIPNKNIERPLHTETKNYQSPFLPEALGNVYYMQGFSAPSNLSILFDVESERKNSTFHPLEFFSFFLNFYSKNSFKDKLIREGLITNFNDQLELQDYIRGIYLIEFELTEKGESKIGAIIAEFFKFVKFVKELDCKADLFQEGSDFSKFSFLFNISSEFAIFPEVEQDNFQRVLDFSEVLQDHTSQDIFTSNQIWKEYYDSDFEQIFDDIVPEKALFMIESTKFKLSTEDELVDWNIDEINGFDESQKEIKERLREEQEKQDEEKVLDDQMEQLNEDKTGKDDVKELEDPEHKNVIGRRLKIGDDGIDTANKKNVKLNNVNASFTSKKEVKKEKSQAPPRELLQLIQGLKSKSRIKSTWEAKKEFLTSKMTDTESDSFNEERILEELFLAPFFDSAIRDQKLKYALDFDNGKQFNFEKVPDGLWERFETHINSSDLDFDPINSLETQDAMVYDMITNCEIPEELSEKEGLIEDIQNQTKEEENPDANKNTVYEPDKDATTVVHKQGHLNLQKVFKIVFNPSMKQEDVTQKMLMMRSLLIFKICMIGEFEKDDETTKPEEIHRDPELVVYHKMYRKTLQPKFAVRIMIENAFLQNNIIKGSAEDKQRFFLQSELLTLYIKHFLSLEYYKDFVKGSDMEVNSKSYAVYLTFIGISNTLEGFTKKMLNAMQRLTHPSTYDRVILENLRLRILNNYSGYSTLTSLKNSTFLLDLMIDQLSLDIRTDEGLKKITKWIYDVKPEDLAKTFHHLLKHNKLTMLFTGNITKENALKMAQNFDKLFLPDAKPLEDNVTPNDQEKTEDSTTQPDQNAIQSTSVTETEAHSQEPPQEINNVLNNMLIRFHSEKQHLMVRQTNIDEEDNNNVYLTYFRTERLSIKTKLISAMISHWLRDYVFDKLRNQMNLGYVAHASTREYYYRTGIIILIQGEKFRPSAIESEIENTVREFQEILEKKSEDEIEGLKSVIVQNFTQFSNSIGDVTGKEWSYLEEEYVLGETGEYEDIAKGIKKDDLIDFTQETMVANQRRITLELFAHEIKPEEKDFILKQELALGGLEYELKTVDEVISLRDQSVKHFSRELLQKTS